MAFLKVGCSPQNERILRGIEWLLSQMITTPVTGWSLFKEIDKTPRLWTTSHVVRCLVEFLQRTPSQEQFSKEKVEIASLKFPKLLYVNETKEIVLQIKKLSYPVPIAVSVEVPNNIIKSEQRPVFMGEDEQLKVKLWGMNTGKEKAKIVVENLITGDKTQKEHDIRVVSKSLQVFFDTITDMKYIGLSIFLGTLLLSLIKSLTLRSVVLSLENIILFPLVVAFFTLNCLY